MKYFAPSNENFVGKETCLIDKFGKPVKCGMTAMLTFSKSVGSLSEGSYLATVRPAPDAERMKAMVGITDAAVALLSVHGHGTIAVTLDDVNPAEPKPLPWLRVFAY